MAQKTLSRIEVVVVKDIASGDVTAQCSGIFNLADVGGMRGGESMGISGAGVDAILAECEAGLKAHMAADGAHTVVDAVAEEAE